MGRFFHITAKLAIRNIFSNVQGNFHTVGKAFARFHFLFADTIDNGKTARYAVSAATFRKFNHRFKAVFAKLRTANFLIFL